MIGSKTLFLQPPWLPVPDLIFELTTTIRCISKRCTSIFQCKLGADDGRDGLGAVIWVSEPGYFATALVHDNLHQQHVLESKNSTLIINGISTLAG